MTDVLAVVAVSVAVACAAFFGVYRLVRWLRDDGFCDLDKLELGQVLGMMDREAKNGDR